MRTITKVLLLVFLMGLAVLLYLVYNNFSPAYEQYKDYNLSGIVFSEYAPSQQIGEQFVQVYYPYYLPEYLYRGDEIQIERIAWKNNTFGEFNIFFRVPIGLKEVILTTDSTKCREEKIDLYNIPTEITLSVGDSKCKEKEDIGSDQEEIIKRSRSIMDNLDTEITDKPFNSSEMESIKSDIKRGRQLIADIPYESDSHKALTKAYLSEWFAWRASYSERLFELKYCLVDIRSILKSKEKDSCYRPDFISYQEYNETEIIYNSEISGNNFRYEPSTENNTQLSIIVDNARRRDTEWIANGLDKCEKSRDLINKTFAYQEDYCKNRNSIKGGIITIVAIIFLEVGILYSIINPKWKKEKLN